MMIWSHQLDVNELQNSLKFNSQLLPTRTSQRQHPNGLNPMHKIQSTVGKAEKRSLLHRDPRWWRFHHVQHMVPKVILMPTSRQQTGKVGSTGSQGGFYGSGLGIICTLPVTFHWPKFSSQLHLTARKAGGCCLAACTGGKENSFGKHLASLWHISLDPTSSPSVVSLTPYQQPLDNCVLLAAEKKIMVTSVWSMA